MDVINHWQIERETQQMQADREELVERIARSISEDGAKMPFKGLHLHRSSVALEPTHGVTIPAFCVIAQGSKEILLGENNYQYDPFHYLLATIELPSIGRVLEATQERPYLGLRLELPPSVVSSVIVETGLSSPPS